MKLLELLMGYELVIRLRRADDPAVSVANAPKNEVSEGVGGSAYSKLKNKGIYELGDGRIVKVRKQRGRDVIDYVGTSNLSSSLIVKGVLPSNVMIKRELDKNECPAILKNARFKKIP